MKSGYTFVRLILITLCLLCCNHPGSPLFGMSSPQPDSSKASGSVQSTADTAVQIQAEKTGTNLAVTPPPKNSLKKRKERNFFAFWIFGKANIDEFKTYLIAYGNNHLPLFTRRYYFRVVEKSYQYPILFLFIVLIILFIVNIIGVIYILYYTNRQKNYKDRYIAIYTTIYENVLRSYLFEEIDWEMTRRKLKRINKPLNRSILTNVLVNFQENLRGDMDTRIPDIYLRLKLHQDAWQLAKSSLYYSKIKGIRELTNLYPKRAKAVVRFYLNSKDDLVRYEAQISYMKLYPEKPFEFFRKINQPFTRWTQLSALQLIRLHRVPVTEFANYLSIEHMNVQNFCLRMITVFQQFENVSAIFKLIDSEHEMTRGLVYRASKELLLTEGKAAMKEKFQVETNKNRIEIIRAFRNIGNRDDFDFLESILNSSSLTEKIEACRTMYFMNTESRERLYLLAREPEGDLENIIVHVSDTRN